MRKSSRLFFAIALLITLAIVWVNPIDRLPDRLTDAFMRVRPAPSAAQTFSDPAIEPDGPVAVISAVRVDEARLMAHVTALAQPRYSISEKAAASSYITARLIDYGLTPIQQRYGPTASGSSQQGGTNIVVELPGSDPNAGAIVLGAHYDTVVASPGADDNGSAIATLLEAARLFAAQAAAGNPSLATLKLVFFDQEEHQSDGSGLLGSLAFTQAAENIAGVKGAVILDMVGYACHTAGCQTYPLRLPLQNLPETGDFLAVLGLQPQSDLIDAFVRAAGRSEPQVLSLPIPQPTLKLFPDLLRSDHAPFWEKNIPALFVSDTANFRNPYYHTPQDTLDTLDTPFFKGSAQHIINAIATLLQN